MDDKSLELIQNLMNSIRSVKKVAFDIEHNPKLNLHGPGFELYGCSFSTGSVTLYIKNAEIVRKITDEVFSDSTVQCIGHNIKYDIQCLKKAGWAADYPVNLIDTMVAVNLLDTLKQPNQLGLKAVVLAYFHHQMMSFEQAIAFGANSKQFTEYACADVYWEWKLWNHLEEELEKQKLLKYFLKIPAVKVFADMETAGFRWDLNKARVLLRGYVELRDRLEQEVYDEVGLLNLNSGDQIAKRLFEDLGYDDSGLKRTTKRVSTDAETMEKLAIRYPICKKIVSYRTAAKMVGTYIVPCSEYALSSLDERIHPSYWLVSATGRTRCSDPNLQNIPGSGADIFKGLDIKSAFIAREGFKLAIFDESQIELRLVAHFSKDPIFLETYRDWRCTACNNKGSSIVILHRCPSCRQAEDEGILNICPICKTKHVKLVKNEIGKVLGCLVCYNKQKYENVRIKGFWHGLDLHQLTASRVPALRGNRQAGKCVHVNTLVTVNHTLIRIGDLCNGREFGKYYDLMGQISAANHSSNTISNFYCDGVKDQYLVLTRKGILVCSSTHKLSTNVGWVEAQNLTNSHIVDSCAVEQLPIVGCQTISFNPYFESHTYGNAKDTVKLELTEHWAYMAGLFIGDGTFRAPDQVGFTGGGLRDEDVSWKQIMIGSLESIGLHVTSISTTKGKSSYSLNIGCRRIGNFFKNQLNLYPKKGVEIVIPKWIWSSKRTALAFIGGLFDTNGYVGNNKDKQGIDEVSICTKSWQLASDLLVLLKACGYYRNRLSISYNKKYDKDYYIVNIERTCIKDTLKLGFIKHPFKSSRVLGLQDYIFADNNVNKVIKVVPCGKSCLVDICVKEDIHSYIANGLNVHNTSNFALVYKAGPVQMNMSFPDFSVREWADVIEEFFELYEGVDTWHAYMEGLLNSVRQTRDIFGRLYKVPVFAVKSAYKHSLNQFINFGPQSSACGICQLAMTNIRQIFINSGDWMKNIFPVCFVHDECVWECRDEYIDTLVPTIIKEMETCVSLEVPLRTSVAICDNWASAKV